MPNNDPFSKRHGYAGHAKEITIREDAPENLRYVVLNLATKLGIRPRQMRELTCSVLRQRPDSGNWSEYPNIYGEVEEHIYGCNWFRVYDIIEQIWDCLDRQEQRSDDDFPWEEEVEPKERKADQFERTLNEVFVEEGIGWQLVKGRIVTRGEESFEAAVKTAQADLAAAGRPTASQRIHEALQALSRRPEPDPAGAISHAIAALECVAGDLTGNDKATFGDILKCHSNLFPGGLRKGLEGIWGYSCNEGARHGKEGKTPEREDAELVVGLAACVSTYLNRKSKE